MYICARRYVHWGKRGFLFVFIFALLSFALSISLSLFLSLYFTLLPPPSHLVYVFLSFHFNSISTFAIKTNKRNISKHVQHLVCVSHSHIQCIFRLFFTHLRPLCKENGNWPSLKTDWFWLIDSVVVRQIDNIADGKFEFNFATAWMLLCLAFLHTPGGFWSSHTAANWIRNFYANIFAAVCLWFLQKCCKKAEVARILNIKFRESSPNSQSEPRNQKPQFASSTG